MAGNNLDLAVRLKFIDQGLKPAIESVKNSIKSLKTQFKDSDVGFEKSIQSTKTLNTELSKTESFVQRAFSVVALIAFGKKTLELAESYKTINARLRNAAESQDQYNESQKRTLDISLKTGTALAGNVALYSKLKVNAGLSADQSGRLVDTLAKAARLDGGGQAAQDAIIQFGQAATSGKLGGDELRSVREQLPTLAEEIRKGLGLTREQFGALAKDGGIAFSDVTKALDKSVNSINEKFATLPLTSGQAFENLKSIATVKIGEIDDALGASSGFAGLINSLSTNLNTVIVLTVAAVTVTTANWLRGISERRAAENLAHIARLKEIAEEQAAQLLAARSAAKPTFNSLGLQTSAPKIDTKAISEAEAALAKTNVAIAASETRFFSLGNIIQKIGGFFRLLVNPVTIVISAIGLFVTYLTSIVNKSGEVGTALEKPASALEVLGAILTLVKEIIGTVLSAFGDLGTYIGGQFTDAISAIGSIVGISMADAADFLRNFVNIAIGIFPATGEAIIGFVTFLVKSIGDIFVNAYNKIVAFAKDTKAALAGDFSFSNLDKASKEQLAKTSKNFEEFKQSLKKSANSLLGTDYVGNISKSIRDQIAKNRAEVASAKFNGEAPSPTGAVAAKDNSGNKLPQLEKVSRDEITLAQAVLDEKKAANERAYAEDVLRAGDSAAKKLELARKYYADLNALATEQTALDKLSLEQELKAKQDQLEALNKFKPKNKGQTEEQTNKIKNLGVEIVNLNAKIQAENIKLETTIADNNAKLEQIAISTAQKGEEALKALDDQISQIAEEATALGLSEAAYKEYLLQKTLATELAKLELAGIEKTSQAYKDQALALETVLRSQQASEDSKKKRDEKKKQEDDIYKNIQQGVQGAFAAGLKSIGSGTSLKELAQNAAGAVRDAVAETIAGSLANTFLNALGGKDAVVGVASSLGFGGKKGDSPANPIFTSSADGPLDIAGADSPLTKAADTLFSKVGGFFSNLTSGLGSFFSSIGSSIGSLFSGGGGGSSFGGIASGIASLFGYAEGGLVSGPGTGTSDSILATNGARMVRFSDGEFVVKQKQTAKYLPLLHAINSDMLGSANRAINHTARASFADGGLISGESIPQPNNGGGTTRIVNVIDPKMAGEYLNSTAGEKTILNVLRRNKSGVQAVLR